MQGRIRQIMANMERWRWLNDDYQNAAIMVNLRGRDVESFVLEALAKVNESIKLPPGYSIDLSGEAEDMAESFGYMGESLILAVVFVYLILIMTFKPSGLLGEQTREAG